MDRRINVAVGGKTVELKGISDNELPPEIYQKCELAWHRLYDALIETSASKMAVANFMKQPTDAKCAMQATIVDTMLRLGSVGSDRMAAVVEACETFVAIAKSDGKHGKGCLCDGHPE